MRKELIIAVIILAAGSTAIAGEIYKCTSYCSCQYCTNKKKSNKHYGITASGEKVREGIVACNHLEFGQVIEIKGLGEFVVADRGSNKYFGSKKHKKLSLDVYKPTHQEALEFGVQYREVVIK